MYQTIKKYCENDKTNGLILIDMPTGAGKTYTVLNYIYDSIMDPENETKFFFITTLKKNLPVKELEGFFAKHKHTDIYREKSLFLDSNVDMVVANLNDSVIKSIPEDIKSTDEFKQFRHFVEMIQKYSKKGNSESDLKSIVSDIQEELRIHREPKFRRMIENLLSKTYKTVNEKLFAIKTDENWKWLGNLYPSVFTRDKQIIFMSMDKAIARNSTIVEPSYQFYTSDIINNSVIFIDEFDATKETLLNNLIANGVDEKIDYIELFNEIYSSLHHHNFPSALTTPSLQRQKSEYKGKTLEQILEGVKEKSDDIYDTYSLQFSHKTVDNDAAASKNFLFQDHQYHSILEGKNRYVVTKNDPKNRVNRIEFVSTKPELEKDNIQSLFGKLRGFISWFERAVRILAINYLQLRQERRKAGEDDFTYEQATKTVLDEFNLNPTYVDFLTANILISTGSKNSYIKNDDFDLSFYQRGFRYYAFEDSPEHDMKSKMMMYSFSTTPEKLILKFCEKAKVIGISATASLESVIGNYDIEYLKMKLADTYISPDKEDRKRMNDDFNRSTCHYNNVNINAKLIGGECSEKYSADWWKYIFDNEEQATYVYELLENNVPAGKDYAKERYYRIAMAYKQFVIHEDIKSFLCILTKHPRNNDNELDIKVLFAIFELIAKNGDDLALLPNKCVRFLNGDEYDTNKDLILRELSNNQKLFVISVYQTIGAGQNLQYKIPSAIRPSLVKINDWDKKPEEKDFDAIYLDKPTNLLVNLGNNLDDQNFVKYLFDIEFFQEGSEISSYDSKKHIEKAFKTFTTQHAQANRVSNIYELNSYVVYSTKALIQAVGRICRTNYKNKNIYIFADYKIGSCIDTSVLNDRMLNPEFKALLSVIETQKAKNTDDILINNANRVSIKANGFINNMLQEEWSEKRMEQWKLLRDFSLRYPTMSQADAQYNILAKNFYVKQPGKNNVIYYEQQKDFNSISISFEKDNAHPRTVASGASYLDDLMKITPIKEYFESNGWATSFEKNEYILSPALFNNIYKGVIGEVAGKFTLEKYHLLKLEEIEDPSQFELFDYKIKDTSIYVDFKNWHNSTDFNNQKMCEKIERKAKECGCKCVFIINLFDQSNSMPRTKTLKDGIKLVIIPSLFNKYENGTIQRNKDADTLIRNVVFEYGNNH